jgi:hypothetical protein
MWADQQLQRAENKIRNYKKFEERLEEVGA